MQFPRVWEDDANSNDSKKVMLHTLRDQLGRTPRGRYRSAIIQQTKQYLPEQVQRTSPTAHHQHGPTPDTHAAVHWISGLFCLRSKLCRVPYPLHLWRSDDARFVQEKLVTSLEGLNSIVSLPVVPHLDKPVLITGHTESRLAQLYKE